MDTATISQSRPVSILAVILGAIGTLIVVGILSQSYFRPHDAFAVQSASSVTCGSPSLLMSGLTSGPGIISVNAGTSPVTQQLLSCTSPFGGTTQTITLKANRPNRSINVTYNFFVDGSSTPLFTVAANRTDVITPSMAAGWYISTDFISTSVPIKFNSSLVITATIDPNGVPNAGATVVGAHAQFMPEAQEVPVKFLNVPLINVNGPVHSIIDGQPIQVRNVP